MWFVINTDLTITTKKLVELFATMNDSYIGILSGLKGQLDLPGSKAAEIDWNYHSRSQRREAYLDLYATSHPCPSWRQVTQTLRCFKLFHQADVVESTYVQGTYMYACVVCPVGNYHKIILCCTRSTCTSNRCTIYAKCVILCSIAYP